jgi:hypothetical protein
MSFLAIPTTHTHTHTNSSTPQNTPSASRSPSISSMRSWQRRNAVTPETLSSDSLVEAIAANDAKQQQQREQRESESEAENLQLQQQQQQLQEGSEHRSKRRRLVSSIKKGWKDHHQSVQGSYEVYYGMGHRY